VITHNITSPLDCQKPQPTHCLAETSGGSLSIPLFRPKHFHIRGSPPASQSAFLVDRREVPTVSCLLFRIPNHLQPCTLPSSLNQVHLPFRHFNDGSSLTPWQLQHYVDLSPPICCCCFYRSRHPGVIDKQRCVHFLPYVCMY